MNDILIDEIKIEDMIYEIRGVQVMLDSDLARLYKVETKALNRQVKRNIERFPNDFCFQLTKEEYHYILRCQNGTLELEQGKYSKYLPYVFSEHGISMLASVLHSQTAVIMSIKIVRAFVKMRHFINENKDIYMSLTNINNKLVNHDEKLDYLFSKFDRKERLFISGETYDAISYIVDIFQSAVCELIVIDSYADKVLLDLLRNVNCNIIIITKNNSKLSETEIKRFNEQYNNLKLIYNESFHDRYFIIDRKTIYHCGASLNHAGSKTFSINLLEDEIVKDNLINYIINII